MALYGRGCLRLWLRAGLGMLLLFYITIGMLSSYSQQLAHNHSSKLAETHRSQVISKQLEINSRRREFYHRHKLMASVCNTSNGHPLAWKLQEDLFLENLILDSKNGWIYCSVLKAGSTFWKRILGVTSGKVNETDPYKIAPISDHTKYLETLNKHKSKDIDTFLSNSTTFMFSRDPYSRLFSCYIDKIFTPRPFYNNLREAILLFTRRVSYGKLLKKSCALDITFSEFVRFVVWSVKTNINADQHFLPMYQLCRPCEVQYDLLGKMDSFREDTEYVLQKMDTVTLPEFTKDLADLDAIIDMVQSVFFERNDSTSCIQFGKFLSIIWQKAIIRGLLSRNETMPSEFLTDDKITEEEFLAAMLKSHKRSASDIEKKNNKKQALVEAFRSVHKEDLVKYHELFQLDFEIFGYEMFPDSIFSESVWNNKTVFF